MTTPPFIRTVAGDIEPTELGVTYSHEHLVMAGGRPVDLNPDFLLTDVDLMVEEVQTAAALGLRAVIDAMPCDAGRDARRLAEIGRRTGIHVVAPTGLHHERFYAADHWGGRLSEDELADLFTADVTEGIDELDYTGPLVRRTEHRAGVVKVAGSDGGPSARDTRILNAAAETHRRTGVPILTHCERGTGAMEQVQLLTDRGVDPGHVVLSHVDKVVDRGYHRDVLGTGAFAEYDGSFRWGDADNGTLNLLRWMVDDGLGDRILLGMDAARQGYYRAYGGTPGLTWLLDGFTAMMADVGLDERVRRGFFVDGPARAFAFVPSQEA